MNKSIKALFEALERAGTEPGRTEEGRVGERPSDAEMSPAEMVGRALLDRLGSGTGLSERELAEAILDVWAHPDKLAPNGEPQEPATDDEAGESAERTPVTPFGEHRRMPKPIRSGAAAPQRIDYDELTDEQFRTLRKQLKKAEADGKKVRI